MRILIVGAGEVGRHLCAQLSSENHEVVLIDKNPANLRRIERQLNIMGVPGSGASHQALEQGGIREADLFIAVTDVDELNLIACVMANEYGVKRKVARVKNEAYLSGASPLSQHRLGIDLIINPDKLMADEIFKLSQTPQAFEVVEFAHGDVVLLGYEVAASNPLCGISLQDTKDLRGLYDFLIVAIVRDRKTIIPRGSDILRSGDKMYLVVKRKDILAIETLLNIRKEKPQKIFIIGGGQVGRRVAKEISQTKIDVFLVETNTERCEELSEQLNSVIILNIDGLESQELLTEGIDTADLVVAVTDSDTTNILSSLLAKHYGAKRCITRISRPDFIPLLGKLGIDIALSPRLVAANSILRFVRRGAILAASSLSGTEAETVELVVSERWQYTDWRIKNINFPPGVNVGAIVRGTNIIVPSGETVIKARDHLILFAIKNTVATLERFLAE